MPSCSAFYRPILPIFADEIYHVGARGLGMLYASPAIGALIGSGILLAFGDVKRKGALSVIVTMLFALSLGLLGLSQWFWMGLIAVGLLGISDAISVAMRRTVVQILAPDDMRGRATSFLTVFAQTTNATGAVIAGAGAALIGAPNAALVGCVLCALTVVGTCWAIPQLWHYRSKVKSIRVDGVRCSTSSPERRQPRTRTSNTGCETMKHLLADDLFEGRCRHARLPGRIAKFQHIAARIEKVQFTPGEVALLAVDHRFGDLDALLMQ